MIILGYSKIILTFTFEKCLIGFVHTLEVNGNQCCLVDIEACNAEIIPLPAILQLNTKSLFVSILYTNSHIQTHLSVYPTMQ